MLMEADVRERRQEKRVPAALAVALDSRKGLTRDVSATGIFFETTGTSISPGAEIDFAVIIDTLGARRILKCQGSVVRMEYLGDRFGVAVKILDSMLAANDQ